ncbi:MAG: hypothetical protein KF762_06830 [Acidobacteria bacterium]|nr:hypothetical protein [Acidobacteriota bacterium]
MIVIMPENDPQKKRPEDKKANVESEDANKPSYYYDDAHGYEDFDPDEEENDDEE